MAELTTTNERKPAAAQSNAVTDLAITGMTCGNCARHVTQAIQSVAGVRSAEVSLEGRTARVKWEPDFAGNPAAVIQAVESEGYGAKLMASEGREPGESLLAGWKLNMLLGVPVTLLLMLGEWLLQFDTVRWFQWLSFVLAGLVQVLAGARFYRGAWAQLKAGSSNMDTLVALGSTTAFGYSAWALFAGHAGHLYFMEAVAIITLISVGHWIESRVSVRASAALRKLLNLAPAMARRQNPDGTETEAAVADLVIGDNVVLRPGDHVPTDGTVVEGNSAVDESMLTGESVPADKAKGGLLYAGTVNLNGRVLMRVTATGEGTALAHVIAAVRRAQSSRADIQRIGDRVSSIFVPLVILIAAAAALWWGLAPESARTAHEWLSRFLWVAHAPEGRLGAAFIIASAVLIIACPCAMGLATPAAIMAGSNAAARRGILVRDGVALEKAGRITAVIFDKTGTLTAGRPELANTWVVQGSDGTVPALAAALARNSNHPVSKAVAGVSGATLELMDWKEVQGAGVQALVRHDAIGTPGQNGKPQVQARLGSLRWLREVGVDLGPGEAFVQQWSAEGATLVALAAEQSLLALFAVRDSVKPGTFEVVRQLNAQGLRTYLATGDNATTAGAIARQAGIAADHVFAEVRPEQKAEFVKQLQRQGQRVAFVGDGINDAPALEQADLGIAVSRASDIAREAADVILLNSEIQAVPESLGLARATLRTIKQNLFWAFFYNAAGIPLAALGFMSPILCAAAMGLSDLVVIGNALRLTRWRLRPARGLQSAAMPVDRGHRRSEHQSHS
ncbi:MAG TPA: cation-translocating P-type ATPase [Verrucomicrobiae bacterium]